MARKSANRYDGTNDYSKISSDFSGNADSKIWTGSLWFRRKGGAGSTQTFYGAGTRVRAYFGSDNKIYFRGENSSGTLVLQLNGSTALTVDGEWHHMLWSFDMSDTAKRFLYIDDAAETLTVTTYSNSAIDFTQTSHAIGARPAASEKFNGDLSEVWTSLGTSTYLEIDSTGIRRKFIDANGHAVDLGSDGSTPTGVSPILYSKAGGATNSGTGGNMTVTGALQQVTGPIATFDYSTWGYKRTLTLDTTGSGANVSTTQTYFPVLLRLTSSNHDFTQTDTNGEDIRFTNAAETIPLDYEIERWNSGSELAEVWVLVPSITGNNTTDIVMFWDKASQASESAPEVVFDIDNNFQGVYHLTNSYGDATWNSNDGTNSGCSDIAGQIARGIDCTDPDIVTVPTASSIEITSNMTVSFWMQPDSLGGNVNPVSKTDSAGNWNIGWGFWSYPQSGNNYLEFWVDDYTEYAELAITDLSMQLIHGVYDDTNNILRTYRNGNAGGTHSYSGSFSDSGDDLILAGTTYVGDYKYTGVLDEVRIEDVVRSADWARLCYQNQQTSDTLVTYGTPTPISGRVFDLMCFMGAMA